LVLIQAFFLRLVRPIPARPVYSSWQRDIPSYKPAPKRHRHIGQFDTRVWEVASVHKISPGWSHIFVPTYRQRIDRFDIRVLAKALYRKKDPGWSHIFVPKLRSRIDRFGSQDLGAVLAHKLGFAHQKSNCPLS